MNRKNEKKIDKRKNYVTYEEAEQEVVTGHIVTRFESIIKDIYNAKNK
jgi:hypothetical protein